MKQIAVSGGSGYVGQFIVNDLLRHDHRVVVLGRKAPIDNAFVGPVEFRYASLADLEHETDLFVGCDAFVHCAFFHEAGKYRGGEGDDPERFRTLNHDGSLALFEAAKSAGVERTVFLSSRAVYGDQPAGATLTEDTESNPDTLYGKLKLETEHALAAMADSSFIPMALRATGVYGPMHGTGAHKWSELFKHIDAGEAIEPRVGTEVHGNDLASAVRILLTKDRAEIELATGNPAMPIFNVSDILLDRRDLVAAYAELTGATPILPARMDASGYNVLDCSRLKKMGWKPRGHLDIAWVTQSDA